MPLILAIEPDKRQSSQLAAIVKGLHAELVLRTTVADGLGALHGRVPDLVLTTSLISPRDDAALGTHLRELGSAGAHVQTVTIPLLGSAVPKRAKGGMLAVLRREKPQAPMTDGCDPGVFAEQIRQYLATAEEQKATAAIRAVAVETIAEDAIVSDAPPEVTAAPEEFLASLEPESVAFEPEPIAFQAAAFDESLLPVAELAATDPEPEAIEEPVAGAENEIEATSAPDELVADEPAGLPLSQLLQLVSDAAPAFEAPVLEAPAVEPIAEPVVEPEPVIAAPLLDAAPLIAVAPELAPVAELEAAPELEVSPASSFGDLYVDPVAAEALDELSRQAPAASMADGIPAEAPVPVVEMHSFQSLDAIASELAAGPAQRHESLDDLASLFAATPTASAPASMVPAADFSAPMHGEKSLFASLFAEPAPARPSKPIEIPGIDPSLFASPASAPVVAFEAPAPLMAVEPEPVVANEPETVVAIEPEPIVPALEPILAAEPEPEPVLAIAPEPEEIPAIEAARVVDELTMAPVVDEVVIEDAPVEEAFVEATPVETTQDELITFEPVVFEPVVEAPAAVAAAPSFDEEIALDVDAFTYTPPAPAAPAEPERFSFTLVDGFGDAMSDFEVPSFSAVASDLGVGEHLPLDPYASKPAPAPAAVREALNQPAAAPALDEESLSLIGDAARKLSLDALVIEEFERGLNQPRSKKAKKKVHAGATQVPAAPAPAAKPTKRPVQDEWGMFDPEQCGFAALDEEEGAETRPTTGTRVRVISY